MTVQYFHGGVPGLSTGDLLRPRNALREWAGREIRYQNDLNGRLSAQRTTGDYVYLTQDIDVARHFAHVYVDHNGVSKPGDVYEVQPLEDIVVDPDYDVDDFRALFGGTRIAKVVKVRERRVVLSGPERERSLGRYLRWQEGPVYDSDGYLIPYPRLLGLVGSTEAELRSLGPWFPFEDIKKRLAGRQK